MDYILFSSFSSSIYFRYFHNQRRCEMKVKCHDNTPKEANNEFTSITLTIADKVLLFTQPPRHSISNTLEFSHRKTFTFREVDVYSAGFATRGASTGLIEKSLARFVHLCTLYRECDMMAVTPKEQLCNEKIRYLQTFNDVLI